MQADDNQQPPQQNTAVSPVWAGSVSGLITKGDFLIFQITGRLWSPKVASSTFKTNKHQNTKNNMSMSPYLPPPGETPLAFEAFIYWFNLKEHKLKLVA